MKGAKNVAMFACKSTSSMVAPLESGIRFTADAERREQLIRVFHGAMKLVVGPLLQCAEVASCEEQEAS